MTAPWAKPCAHVWHKQSVCHVLPHPRLRGGTLQTLLTEVCTECGRVKCSAWLGLIELYQFDVAYKLDSLRLRCVEE